MKPQTDTGNAIRARKPVRVSPLRANQAATTGKPVNKSDSKAKKRVRHANLYNQAVVRPETG